jgi:alkylation response protein AidB-like acyl-CoA dehydrogenase
MNFDYSEDQKFLKDEARKYLAAHCRAEQVRALVGNPGVGFDKAIWDGIAGQGWLGVTIPEEFGGLGMGPIDLCAIAEEVGRACAPVPFGSTLYYVVEALLLAGTLEQKQAWLPAIAAGSVIGCFAAAERPGPISFETVTARVVNDRLTGTKLPVPDGGLAQVAIVLARDGDRLGLFVASLDNVERAELVTIDPSRGAARLEFRDIPVERLEDASGNLMATLMQRAAIYTAFEQLGGTDRCLEMARDFALGRYAFGRPIASYQAIKHKLADMYIKAELARAHAYYGAWALGEEGHELPLAAAAARVAACDAYWFAAKENIQVHGGMGFTWEADPQLFYRRSRHLALVGGAAREWKQRLAAALELRVAA